MYNVQNVVKENQFNIIISVSKTQHNLLITYMFNKNLKLRLKITYLIVYKTANKLSYH